jgi:hypothetical protein
MNLRGGSHSRWRLGQLHGPTTDNQATRYDGVAIIRAHDTSSFHFATVRLGPRGEDRGLEAAQRMDRHDGAI